jgi:Holliday junction resolvase
MEQIWLQQLLTVGAQLLLQHPDTVAVWALVLVSMGIGGFCYHLLATAYQKRRTKRRLQRGHQAEQDAVKYLQRRGYRILAAQLEETITVYVDGEPQNSTVRADFLARKGRKTYIVEVKSGQQGTVRLPHVRRQLLEYKLVYQPDGVLLLDMEHRTLQEICFAYPQPRRREWLRYGVVSVLTGIIVYGMLQI